MKFSWEYPLYLLPHEQGYASLIDENGAAPVQLLIVCTAPQVAVGLMEQFSMLGVPRALRSDREFRWLLQSVKLPVTEVAFDPAPTDNAIHARWRVAIAELLSDHLQRDHSPWNYPVFAIGQTDGFACIDAVADDPSALRALGLFTSTANAEAYLRDAGQQGDILELADMDSAVTFLSALQAEVAAVAVDPRVVDGRHAAEHCLGIEVLLTKYLVRDQED